MTRKSGSPLQIYGLLDTYNPFIQIQTHIFVRDRSIKVLKHWLSKRKEIDELDLDKMWKGLFYCTCIPYTNVCAILRNPHFPYLSML